MRKIVLITMLALVLGALPMFSACTQSQPAQTIELTYSNFFPPTHLNSVLAQSWINEIQTRSNGQVKITYYPGGSLTPAAQIYDGVVQGRSDIGMSVLSYTMGLFPASELIDLRHGYPNG